MGTGERSARGLALIIIIVLRSPANLSKTRLKFSKYILIDFLGDTGCSTPILPWQSLKTRPRSMQHSWSSILENFEDRESRGVCRRPRPFEKFLWAFKKVRVNRKRIPRAINFSHDWTRLHCGNLNYTFFVIISFTSLWKLFHTVINFWLLDSRAQKAEMILDEMEKER